MVLSQERLLMLLMARLLPIVTGLMLLGDLALQLWMPYAASHRQSPATTLELAGLAPLTVLVVLTWSGAVLGLHGVQGAATLWRHHPGALALGLTFSLLAVARAIWQTLPWPPLWTPADSELLLRVLMLLSPLAAVLTVGALGLHLARLLDRARDG